MNESLSKEIVSIKEEGLYRQLRGIVGAPAKYIELNGKKLLNLSSNDYLGLSQDADVINAGIEATKTYGAGGTSSRLVAGNLEIHTKLEKCIADFKGSEASLVYPSGFQANVGVISALAGADSCIIMDKLNHASLWDGAKLSKARIFVYEHCDLYSLEKTLQRTEQYKRKLLITETIYSMDGDIAPLKEIAALAKQYNAWLMIDEAHATGIFGEHAKGIAELCGVEKDVAITIGTLSKAFGVSGGYVCGSKELIEYMINKSRAFIYSTAISPFCAGAAIKAIEKVKANPSAGKKLIENSEYLRNEFKILGFNTLNSQSQIIPLLTETPERTAKFSQAMLENGIFVPAIRPPTVPENKCRLRFSLTTQHTKEDMNVIYNALRNTKE